MTHIFGSKLGHHWLRSSLVAWSAPSHYLNQCCNIVNWTLRNKLEWNFNQNSNTFIEENTFENVVCEMLSILSQPQCVNQPIALEISIQAGVTLKNRFKINKWCCAVPLYRGHLFIYLFYFFQNILGSEPMSWMHHVTLGFSQWLFRWLGNTTAHLAGHGDSIVYACCRTTHYSSLLVCIFNLSPQYLPWFYRHGIIVNPIH